MAKQRARVWTTVLYPESVKLNYRDIFTEKHLTWVESPLHDADLNGDDSEKKAHVHVVFLFPGMKSYDEVRLICDSVGGVSPQTVHNTRAMVRYLIHIDNPEKHQYSRSDIFCGGGADVDEYFKLSHGAIRDTLIEIQDYCSSYGIEEFHVLCDRCISEGRLDWFDVINFQCTLAISAYLKSKHFARLEDQRFD